MFYPGPCTCKKGQTRRRTVIICEDFLEKDQKVQFVGSEDDGKQKKTLSYMRKSSDSNTVIIDAQRTKRPLFNLRANLPVDQVLYCPLTESMDTTYSEELLSRSFW